mgnify:CR=1 FL=1
MKSPNTKQGYTLLFSVILSLIVLSIAAFILSVSRKQFILSSAARDSTVAIYAADSGIQCATEAFFKDQLSTSTTLSNGVTVAKSATISCAAIYPTPMIYPPITDSQDFVNSISESDVSDMGLIAGTHTQHSEIPEGQTFVIYQTRNPLQAYLPNNTCVRIIVTDGYYIDSTNKIRHKTVIESNGYNISNSGPCNASNLVPNPRAVERTIRLEYKG